VMAYDPLGRRSSGDRGAIGRGKAERGGRRVSH
jgi:hypothetical protein